MPLKYYCPKCEKRYVDWGAEKLGFKCPTCVSEALLRVGTFPEGEDGAPSLSKAAAKRKAKPKAKAKVASKAVTPDDDDPFAIEVDADALDADVTLDDEDDDVGSVDSLVIDDD